MLSCIASGAIAGALAVRGLKRREATQDRQQRGAIIAGIVGGVVIGVPVGLLVEYVLLLLRS